jgi:ABC-2 type transport system permease protein
MKKYWQVLRSTWDEMTTYRFNFLMWRVRNVVQLLTVYFLWLTVTPQNGTLFGYSREMILTYILLGLLFGSIVLSTRTQEIGENIDNGDVANFLVKPFHFFRYWFARDIGDKLFNISFAVCELVILYFILRPPVFLQTDPALLALTGVAVVFAILINFFIGCLLGMVAFWSPEVWAPRFIFFILISFFSGGLFPLDIFPAWAQEIFKYSPLTYLQYFPIKLYLGAFHTQQILTGFFIAGVWVILLYAATQFVWHRGLRNYSSQGN